MKSEPISGARGFCRGCGSKMFARCGGQRIHHWAHKSKRVCDSWRENETEWHRQWKNYFPSDWQEKVLPDKENGENHIADIHTEHGLTVEFQHSYIKPEERISREQFYDNMIWVVDGTRLKRDFPRFQKNQELLRRTAKQGRFIIDYVDECFTSSWIDSRVPVVFDFKGLGTNPDLDGLREYLICLMPNQGVRNSVVYFLTHDAFVNNVISSKWFVKEHQPDTEPPSESEQKTVSRRRSSKYVVQRGKWVKKRRL